ncbi:MAG: hypothetical protein GOVbin631_8 [Prokaryotic dsDNA virus sp.]|nr:MAG: hypothetical protein GOVbin631_8 [Prokaryotic dsDNA virus sp.]
MFEALPFFVVDFQIETPYKKKAATDAINIVPPDRHGFWNGCFRVCKNEDTRIIYNFNLYRHFIYKNFPISFGRRDAKQDDN